MPKIKLFLREIKTKGNSKWYSFQSYQAPEIGATIEIGFNTQPYFYGPSGSGVPDIPYDEKDIGELFYLDLPERALPK